jgi:hypothetical protein
MRERDYCKRILRLHGHIEDRQDARRRDGIGARVVMEQPRPFDVDAVEAAFASL